MKHMMNFSSMKNLKRNFKTHINFVMGIFINSYYVSLEEPISTNTWTFGQNSSLHVLKIINLIRFISV